MVGFNRKKSEAEKHEKHALLDIIGNNRKHVSKRPDDEVTEGLMPINKGFRGICNF